MGKGNVLVKECKMRAALLHSLAMVVGHQPSAPMTLAALLSGQPALVVTAWNVRPNAPGCAARDGAGDCDGV